MIVNWTQSSILKFALYVFYFKVYKFLSYNKKYYKFKNICSFDKKEKNFKLIKDEINDKITQL